MSGFMTLDCARLVLLTYCYSTTFFQAHYFHRQSELKKFKLEFSDKLLSISDQGVQNMVCVSRTRKKMEKHTTFIKQLPITILRRVLGSVALL